MPGARPTGQFAYRPINRQPSAAPIAGRDEGGAVVDAGVGHDVRVDEDDVGHGDEGRQAGEQFGTDAGAVFAELEQPVQPAGGGALQGCCLGLALDAFHWAFLIVLVVDHPEHDTPEGRVMVCPSFC